MNGFTLLEIVIVLTIVVMIMSFSYPSVDRMMKQIEIKNEAKQVRKAIIKKRRKSMREGIQTSFTYKGKMVVFYPNGRTHNAIFEVKMYGLTKQVRLRGFTGEVTID